MSQWVALATLTRKEVVRVIRIWPQTLLPPVITMALYFIIFGTLIGSQVSDMRGVSYVAFITPGLVMMSILTNAYTNVSSSFFSTKFMRSIEELLVSPAKPWVIVFGYVLGGMTRGLMVGVLVVIISLFFTRITIHSISLVLLFSVLTALVFSLAGLLNGIFAKKFDDVAIIPTFVLVPLTYLGGVFYSITLLPEPWYTLSLANPVLYMVNGLRYGFLGVSDISVWIGLGMLIFFTVALLAANVVLIERGIRLRN